MQIYNTSSTELSIVHEAWSLCDANVTNYPLADVIRRINAAYEELIAEIINADGTWQYDDTNWTDLPRGTGTLVEGQQAYTFASEYLEIDQIEIKDNNGKWIKITPLDKSELGDQSPDEHFGVDSSSNPVKGFPWFYDQVGDTILLYYAPTSTNVTLSGGIRVTFKRTADIFTISDTTQSPGLPSSHHVLLAYMAALPYCAAYKKDRVPFLEKKIGSADRTSPLFGGMKRTLIEHYARREKSKRKVMTMAPISFR